MSSAEETLFCTILKSLNVDINKDEVKNTIKILKEEYNIDIFIPEKETLKLDSSKISTFKHSYFKNRKQRRKEKQQNNKKWKN